MKLYDGGRAPNPRRVRIFLAEKGMSLPVEKIDLANARTQDRRIHRAQPVAARARCWCWMTAL